MCMMCKAPELLDLIKKWMKAKQDKSHIEQMLMALVKE